MHRILVVEDDHDLQALYRTIFNRLGYESVPALSTAAGIEYLSKETFDLVILDMNLPDQPGIRVIEYTREHLNGLPIVVVSANEQWREDCAALGVTTFLLKPVTLSHLKEVVARTIQV